MKEVKSFKDITVEQFIALQGIKGETMEDQKKIIEIIFSVNPDSLPIDEFFNLASRIPDIFSGMNKKVLKSIKTGGVTLTLKDIKDFSTKEFIDFDTLAKDGKENLLTLLALMYSNDEFDEMDYFQSIETKKELLKEIPAEEALGALDFFIVGLMAYVKNIVDSSPVVTKMMTTKPEVKAQMDLLNEYLSTTVGK